MGTTYKPRWLRDDLFAGITLARIRDLLRIEGAEDRVGRIDRFAKVDDVVDHFQGGRVR
jgi:hypothetical protein